MCRVLAINATDRTSALLSATRPVIWPVEGRNEGLKTLYAGAPRSANILEIARHNNELDPAMILHRQLRMAPRVSW